MYYPGQPVYSIENKTVAIFTGYDLRENKITNIPKQYALLMIPDKDDPSTLELDVTELGNIRNLIRKSDNKITGQEIYYGPKTASGAYTFRKPYWGSVISDKELEDSKNDYHQLITELNKEEWITKQYTIEV
jgi:hypothetical protein